MMSIGIKIKEARLIRQMTQEELAHKVGYTSRSAINKIEMGKVDIPATRISALANALGVSEKWLLDLDDEDADLSTLTLIYKGLKQEERKTLLSVAQALYKTHEERHD